MTRAKLRSEYWFLENLAWAKQKEEERSARRLKRLREIKALAREEA